MGPGAPVGPAGPYKTRTQVNPNSMLHCPLTIGPWGPGKPFLPAAPSLP